MIGLTITYNFKAVGNTETSQETLRKVNLDMFLMFHTQGIKHIFLPVFLFSTCRTKNIVYRLKL